MVIAGIDPGFDGALAFLDTDSGGVAVHDMPVTKVGKQRMLDEHAIMEMFGEYDPIHVFIEKVQPKGQEGRASLWSFAYGAGIIRGITRVYCHIRGASLTYVMPQTWQKRAFKGMPKKGSTKGRSVHRAQELFSGVTLKTERGRVLDGRADALLIADYGKYELGQAEQPS